MSETIERTLAKWAAPALIAAALSALLLMSSSLLSRSYAASEKLAVLDSIVREDKIAREKAADANSSDHKVLFDKVASLASKPELDFQVTQLKAQILSVEVAVKQLETQLIALKSEVTGLQLQVKLLVKP